MRGIPFDLERDSIAIPSVCPVLGIPIAVSGSRHAGSPSLDRVLPSRGYVKGNVRVISDRANRLKSDQTAAELGFRSILGPVDLRREYSLIEAYVQREALLAEIWLKAAKPGREGEEWAKLASALERVFSRQSIDIRIGGMC